MPKSPALDAAVLAGQARTLLAWFGELRADLYAAPTLLDGWDVRALLGHLVVMHEGLAAAVERPSRDRPMEMWALVSRYAPAADEIGATATDRAGEATPAELLTALSAAVDAVEAAFTGPRLPAVVTTPRGPGRLGEFVQTRLVDLVVHCDDLGRSLSGSRGPDGPGAAELTIERKALASACRTLAQILAERHPGKSVEVRVPPYAAVQCGVGEDGPTHTRGTPPNVVETDPRSWLRLATGRLSWAELRAQGRISASGHRADLTSALPLLS